MRVYGGGPATKGAPLETDNTTQIMFHIEDWWNKEGLLIHGGAMDDRKLAPMLCDLKATGRAKPEIIVSSEIDIEQVREYYRSFSDHEEMKVDDQESQGKERLQGKMAKVSLAVFAESYLIQI